MQCAMRHFKLTGDSPLFTYRRTILFSTVFSLVVAILLGNFSHAQSVAQSRIVNPIRDQQRSTLRNTTPALVKRSFDTGRMPANQKLGRMVLLLAPPGPQEH